MYLKNQVLIVIPNQMLHFLLTYRICVLFFKIFYLFIFREGEGREQERERNISVWVPLACPLLGTWAATQPCDLTGNGTRGPLVHRPVLNPLSYTSQGMCTTFEMPPELVPLWASGYSSYAMCHFIKSQL